MVGIVCPPVWNRVNNSAKNLGEVAIAPCFYDPDVALEQSMEITPPLWRYLVKILTTKPRHASSFSLERTVVFEKIP